MIFLPELPSALATVKLIPNDIAKMGYDDCPPHPTWIEPIEWLGSAGAEKYPLHNISPHGRHRLHSQLNNTKLREKYTIQGRDPIWMNPQDAKARNIKHSDVVRVFNDRGEILAGAFVTDRIRPKVVRLC